MQVPIQLSPALRLITVVFITTLAACATTPYQETSSNAVPDSVIATNPDQLEELDSDQDLPKQALTSDLLAQLLLMNMASYQAEWSTASEYALSAATTSRDYRVARMATMLSLQDSNYPRAVEGAQLWTELTDDITAKNMRLLAMIGADDPQGAIVAVNELAASQGLAVEEHVKQIAGLLVRQENSGTAIQVAEHLVQSHPESEQAYVSGAYVAEHFEQFDQAEQWVAQALTIRPDWDLAGQMQARLLQTQGKREERRQFIEEFVAKNPKSIAMRINYAAELARDEDYDAAYKLVLKVLRDAPRDASALQYAGGLAEQLKNPKAAAKHYRDALDVEPRNDDLRWSLGRLAVMSENFRTAERHFNEITDDELYVRAQIQVANMRNETQGYRVAVNTLRALQPRTTKDFVDIALTRHYLLMEAHQYDEALGYINETIVYLPNDNELLYARALVAAEIGKLDITEQDLRGIIAREPDNANALNALGYTLADQTDRYEEAKALIEKALELRPEDAHILDSMGWVLYRLGDYEGAIDYLQQALDKSDSSEIAAHLGEVLWESGDSMRANEVWQASFSKDPDNPVLMKTLDRYGISFDIAPQS